MDIASLYKLYLENPCVQTDTRKLKQGDIFFALSGANFDGNEFAAKAIELGAKYAVIDNPKFVIKGSTILVENVLDCLQQLAKFHRTQFNIPFIAITGSNGKTTTKELIAAVLREKYVTCATEGNFNNHIGIPLTLLKIKTDAQIAIIEMGANHQHEIEGYCKIALPTHGIITNCGKAHIEGFGGIEGVRKGKGELFDYLRATKGTIFRNKDLDYLADMAKGIDSQITYGSANAFYTGHPVMNDVFVDVALSAPENVIMSTHLVGTYNFPNVMVAIAVGLHFGVDILAIKKALIAYEPDNSRSQLLQKGTNKIILDAYNANPSSMKEAIQNFATTDMPAKTIWLGGMKEMGADEEKEHKELVALIDKYQWDSVILVGKEFKNIPNKYVWFDNSTEAAAFIKSNPPTHKSILIKGSRGSRMELMEGAI